MSGIKIVFMLCIVSVAGAVTAEQDDWTAGPRVFGPVGDFGQAFSASVNIEWSTPDRISLTSGIAFFSVEDDFDGATSVFPCDIDGDGDIDVAGSALTAGEISWWENSDSLGLTWEKHLVDDGFPGACSIVAADIDGDGDTDLVGAGKTLYGGNDIAWWENTEGAGDRWEYHLVSGGFAGAHAAAVGDVDGDGDIDIFGASMSRDEVVCWENTDGLGQEWEQHVAGSSFDGSWTLSPGDYDGDGDLDIAAGAFYADDVAWFENADAQGASWVRHDIDTDFDGVYFIHSLDIDADGDLDLFGAAAVADAVVWWENRSGVFEKHFVDEALDGAVCVHGCDIDNDGDGDVLATSNSTNAVILYLNDAGTWTKNLLSTTFGGAFAVSAGDMDSDGDLDPVGAAMTGDAVAWWDRSPGIGALESSILYTGCDPMWGTIDWTAETPAGTMVAFQVRASDDYTAMGDWSVVLTGPCRLSDHLADSSSYVQYRVLLNSDRPGDTPILERVEISWVSTGLSEGYIPVPERSALLGITPNPALSAPVIDFYLDSASRVRMAVFDITGRLVWDHEQDAVTAGYHQLLTTVLAPGVYICRMFTDGFEDTGRFVIIN